MPVATPAQPSFPRLHVAIVGGGPAGLSAAIALLAIPGVEVTIYEQARELREIGAGLRIGYNAWRVLELLGAADHVFGHVKDDHQQRDGVTGEMLYKYPPHVGDPKYHDIRARRTVLQAALKSQVPEKVIRLRKRLQAVKQLPTGGVRLSFEDGSEAYADLVIGADGIRSVMRSSVYPGHQIVYNGTTIWRCLTPLSLVDDLSITKYTAFHHGPKRKFKCSVVSTEEEITAGEGLWEMTLRAFEDPKQVQEKKFSWGIPCTNERVASHFTEFTPEIRAAIDRVPEGTWREFSAFSGPRLEHVISFGNTVLIGDASHPLLGAFGSGAAFAMEDGWLIGQIVRHFLDKYPEDKRFALSQGLDLFDRIRSPYYARMYKYLDTPQPESQKWGGFSPTPENPLGWIYGHDIGEEWKGIEAGL